MGKRSRGGSGYFQGWYLKHEKEGQVLALIPAYHRDQQGKTSASLQVVTREKAYHMDYPAEDFDASGDRLSLIHI